MPKTYEPIATTTLGSSQTTVTFSSVSGSYTDLVLVASFSLANSVYQPILRFNSDTGSNYSATALSGNGSSAVSSRHTNQNGIYVNPGAGTGSTLAQPLIWICNIMNYANTTTYKTAVNRFNNAGNIVNAEVGLWRNTAAITTVSLTAESGSGDFQSGSTFTLYGILAA